MKIERIEVVNLRFDYPGGTGFRYAGGTVTSRVTSLVLVHTDGAARSDIDPISSVPRR